MQCVCGTGWIWFFLGVEGLFYNCPHKIVSKDAEVKVVLRGWILGGCGLRGEWCQVFHTGVVILHLLFVCSWKNSTRCMSEKL